MAGVRDELAHPHLALLPRFEGAVHMVEHAVERGADLPDLGPGIGLGLGDALVEHHLAAVQREFGDTGRGRGDAAQRPQIHADHDRSGRARRDEGRGGDE